MISFLFFYFLFFLGCVCFGWEWNLENILHSDVCLGAHVKLGQIENHFLWPRNSSPSTITSFTHSIYLQTKFYRLKNRKRERAAWESHSEIHPNPNLVRSRHFIPLHALISTLFPFLPLFSPFFHGFSYLPDQPQLHFLAQTHLQLASPNWALHVPDAPS